VIKEVKKAPDAHFSFLFYVDTILLIAVWLIFKKIRYFAFCISVLVWFFNGGLRWQLTPYIAIEAQEVWRKSPPPQVSYMGRRRV